LLDLPGKRLPWYGGFSTEITGNAKKSPCERTFETLRTCGWQGDDLSDLTGIDANEVEVVIEIDTYEGEERNRIKWVNQPGGGAALKNVMAPDARKAFAAKMRGQALRSKGAAPQQQSQQRPSGGGNAGGQRQGFSGQQRSQQRPQNQRDEDYSGYGRGGNNPDDDIPF